MSAAAIKWAKSQPFKGSAKSLLLAMAEVVNGDGQCWLTQRQLAERLGCSTDTIRRGQSQLVAAGAIERLSGGVGQRPVRYRLQVALLVAPQNAALVAPQNAALVAPQNAVLSPAKCKATSPAKPQVALLAENSKQEIAITPEAQLPFFPAANGHSRGACFQAEFEAWWEGYPLRLDKGDAQRAYTAARQRGASAACLLTARDHYVKDCQVNDRKLKHAATFLNKDRWSEWLEAPVVPAPFSVTPLVRVGQSPYRAR